MASQNTTTEIPHLYSEPIKWEYTGLTVIDLWQLMEYFNAHDFAKCIQEVFAFEMELKQRMEGEGSWDKDLPSWEDEDTNALLKKIGKVFTRQEFPQTSNVIVRVYSFANSKCTYNELYMRIVALRDTMEDELRQRKLVSVPGLKTEFCDKKDGFGENVAIAFTSTERDIREAGNCYAIGLNTACVFHLMRVLEKGLRSLAKGLDVHFDIENWGRIIEQIEKAILLVEKEPKSPQKISRQQFYGECALEFRYFKNAWRNHVMHAASTYDESEAEKIMEHVKNFMQRISLNLSE